MTTPTPTAENRNIARNVNIWKSAAVYVSDEDDAVFNEDGTPTEDWMHVGILAGGSAIGQERDADRTEVEGWAAQLIDTDQRFKKDTRTMNALEDTKTTFGLMYPNSEYNEGGPTVVMVPEDARKVVAFKTINQHGKALIEITREKANIYPSNMDKSDEGASGTEFTIDVRADADNALYDRMEVDVDTTTTAPEVKRFKVGSGNGGDDNGGAEGE